MQFPDFKNEIKCFAEGYNFVIGCDEAGRGPMAGPVVAVACVLDKNSIGKNRSKNKWYARVRDSKLITEAERNILEKEIKSHVLAWGVGEVSHKEVDKINIHNASLLAMRRAVEKLGSKLGSGQILRSRKVSIFIDGRFIIPDLEVEGWKLDQKAIIDGDAKILSISAASIIAKVHRDTIMERLDGEFPGYGFARHKGYNTKEHQKALKNLGATPVHRRSFLKIGV